MVGTLRLVLSTRLPLPFNVPGPLMDAPELSVVVPSIPRVVEDGPVMVAPEFRLTTPPRSSSLVETTMAPESLKTRQ